MMLYGGSLTNHLDTNRTALYLMTTTKTKRTIKNRKKERKNIYELKLKKQKLLD